MATHVCVCVYLKAPGTMRMYIEARDSRTLAMYVESRLEQM